MRCPGDAFPIAWPRATVRRGSVTVGKAVAAGSGKVRIEQVDCGGDSIKVTYAADEPVPLKLTVDGTVVAQLADSFDPATGTGKVVAYPVLKVHERLQIDVKGSPGPVDVKLP